MNSDKFINILMGIFVIVVLLHIIAFVFGVDNNPKTKWFGINWEKVNGQR